jgi:hypothetical protein
MNGVEGEKGRERKGKARGIGRYVFGRESEKEKERKGEAR